MKLLSMSSGDLGGVGLGQPGVDAGLHVGVAGDADHDLLVQARRSTAITVSNDRFVDYRREQA